MKKQNLFQTLGRVLIFPAILAIASLGGVFFSQSANAEGTPDYRLQISPTQANIGTLDPGSSHTGKFKVQNTGSKPYNYKISVAPFSVSGLEYNNDFANPSKYTEMTDWVTYTDSGNGYVDAGNQSVIEYTITVPEDAPGGSQSAALIVSIDNNSVENNSGVQTVSQVAYYFYANINGDTKIGGEITSNKVPSFLFNPPIRASSTVKNTGNVYTEVGYFFEVRELFGDKVVYTNVSEENGVKVVPGLIIYPETERYNEIAWEGAPQLGLFKVKQEIKIFDEISTVEKIVFICPIWFLVIIILFLAMIAYIIISGIRRRKQNA